MPCCWAQAEPLARSRRDGIQVLNPHPDCLAELLIECPFLQSVYEPRRYGPRKEKPEDREVALPAMKDLGTFKLMATPQEEDPLRLLEAIVERTARHVDVSSLEEAAAADRKSVV